MPEATADPKTIREIADQIEQVKDYGRGRSHEHEVADRLLNKAIAHGAFSGTEFLTMHAIMDSFDGGKHFNSDEHKAFHHIAECREWLQAHRPDLDDDEEWWSFTIIASALRDEADKMADAPKVSGQTSVDGDGGQTRAAQWFEAAWYFKHSGGIIDVDRLRRAGRDGRVTWKKPKGRHQYELESVCSLYTDHRIAFQAAASK